MPDPLEPLSVNPDDFCIIDTETRSTINVKVGGAYAHTANCRVVIVTYALGLGPVQEWCLDTFDDGARLAWADAPADLSAFRARAVAGEAWFVAWNAGFDRLAMSRGMIGRAFEPEHFIDAMAQGVKSHLPPDLMGASIAAKVKVKKQDAGKRLIDLFSDEASPATPQTHPEEWAQFRSYARDDVAATQELFFGTLPLSRVEWEDYWVNERINDRGLPVDVDFARGASALAELNASNANSEIVRLTGGAIRTVNQGAAILDWIRYRLRNLPEVDRILTREVTEEPTEDGEDMVLLPHFSLERTRVEELIPYLERIDEETGLTDEEWAAFQVLEVRLYGASATPRKFTKMLPLVEDGRVKGQYVFNGAPATGRYSSRGLQVHNLSRATIGTQDDELDAIEAITAGGADAYDAMLKRFGPIGRTLTRLIRPVICALRGQTMMWMDWSAIEARVLPWLAGPGDAERVLEVFNTNDADPSAPDIYKIQAGLILGIDPKAVSKAQRQSHGKVPILALGFAGGNGALFAMARAYGAAFTEDEATGIVQAWRQTNPWAVSFWSELWDAVLWCMDNPGEPRMAGRVTYLFDPDYFNGTMFCVLPCGRTLLYPHMRWEERERKDKLTGKVETRIQLTYRRGRARAGLHKGVLAENITQATAASILRHSLRRLRYEAPNLVIGHTHDEIVCMTRDDHQSLAAGRQALERVMLEIPEWAEGLPLKAELSVSDYYTKTID